MPDHIVLAYSGGLDTSVAVHFLKNHYGAKITCALIDLGQTPEEIQAASDRAVANGAEGCIVVPAKQLFAAAYVAPAIQANALYEGAYPLGTALNRPLIAKALVAVARQVGADAVAHGCTGKGNDQVRIEAGVAALAPDLVCLAPQRDQPMTRTQAIAYANEHGLALPEIHGGKAYSIDENIWSRSAEGGDIEDLSLPVNEAAYGLTVAPEDAPDTPTEIMLTFEAGLPIALDGTPLPLDQLIESLNAQAGAHGIGRIDHVENRLVGIKSREIYEAPAAITIFKAKQALETITLTKEEYQTKPFMEQKFAEYVYNGQWYAPVMDAVNAFIQTTQAHVNGTVTLKLYKGTCTVVARESNGSLYDTDLATYGNADAYDHQSAKGFIQVWSLPQKVTAKARGAPDFTMTLVPAASKETTDKQKELPPIA
jgi:argininosuccinate synthase